MINKKYIISGLILPLLFLSASVVWGQTFSCTLAFIRAYESCLIYNPSGSSCSQQASDVETRCLQDQCVRGRTISCRAAQRAINNRPSNWPSLPPRTTPPSIIRRPSFIGGRGIWIILPRQLNQDCVRQKQIEYTQNCASDGDKVRKEAEARCMETFPLPPAPGPGERFKDSNYFARQSCFRDAFRAGAKATSECLTNGRARAREECGG